MPSNTQPFWKTKTLAEMTQAEWESLCDGCAQCCQIRLEDEDTGELATTDVVCHLLDCGACRCTDYKNRTTRVPDCLVLTPALVGDLGWLPATCAYRVLPTAAISPGGTRWCRVRARRCTRPASRCAAARSARRRCRRTRAPRRTSSPSSPRKAGNRPSADRRAPKQAGRSRPTGSGPPGARNARLRTTTRTHERRRRDARLQLHTARSSEMGRRDRGNSWIVSRSGCVKWRPRFPVA